MTKEELQAFEDRINGKLDREFKRQNYWIKFIATVLLAFIVGLGYCILQIGVIKNSYVTKTEFEKEQTALKESIYNTYGINIQLTSCLANQIKAKLIEKDSEKYQELLKEEKELNRERVANSYKFDTKGAKIVKNE